MAAQVSVGHFPFAEGRVRSPSARGEDERREVLLVEENCVVQPRLEDGGGLAAVFGRAKHDDHVGGAGLVNQDLGFVKGGLALDVAAHRGNVPQSACAQREDS